MDHAQGCRSAEAEQLSPTFCSLWRGSWMVLRDFQVEFFFPFWHSTGSHCQSSDQVLLLPLSAGGVESRLWQSRSWTFLLVWSQGGPEKLTSKSTSINGITALLGTTFASLSFPLQHFQILFLSSSQYVGLFALFCCHFPLTTPNGCNFSFFFSNSAA